VLLIAKNSCFRHFVLSVIVDHSIEKDISFCVIFSRLTMIDNPTKN